VLDNTPAREWDEAEFEAVLDCRKAEGAIDASGVRISSERLERLLQAGLDSDSEELILKDANFERAIFQGDAAFYGATFKGHANFFGATFESDAIFAFFGGPTFEGMASFSEATFKGNADFSGATFRADAGFERAIFEGEARFGKATFEAHAEFEGATFEGARNLGPILSLQALSLDRTVFKQPVRIEASARALSCLRAQFRSRADLLLRWADVVLDDADFADSSMLAPRVDPVYGESALQERLNLRREAAPRVMSLRRAKVGNLTISGADLRACRFEGAYGLDQLRLERVLLAETPRGWQRTKSSPVPVPIR
jgi:uncharacterized protein YjbI with pentapeptide repeats